MFRNNKGSILITTLIFFSIIIIIVTSCIEIVYGNNMYFKMQYKQVQIKEDLISSIEIMKGNIIYILENEENAFEYLNENTSEILNISDLKNITLKISDKKFEEENITFKITGTYKDTKYEDYIVVDVEIVSPNIVNINYLED